MVDWIWLATAVLTCLRETIFYLRVTIIGRYIYLRIWVKANFARTNIYFAICMWKWYRVDIFKCLVVHIAVCKYKILFLRQSAEISNVSTCKNSHLKVIMHTYRHPNCSSMWLQTHTHVYTVIINIKVISTMFLQRQCMQRLLRK